MVLPVGIGCSQEDSSRPNVIVILTDDMGYSDIGCYGGEIETPNIDNLAENGLRWAQFYNNARSCPSRAALMTGLYPHQAGMGWMAAANMQTPEYQGFLNDNCVTLGEAMGANGYETYMVGKWHLCSEWQCAGNVKEKWPHQRGFQHFYGIPEGASNYFRAAMVRDDERLPRTTDEDHFYITDALSDTAAAYVAGHDFKKKPLFMYLAFNAPHWPLHALESDIERFRDRYMRGWDKLREDRFARQVAMGLFAPGVELSPRDARVPAWDSLDVETQREYAMRMAIYAAQVYAVDRGIGKLVAALKAAGQFDNTVILFMDDNGACAEYLGKEGISGVTGKADTWESYRINWANLSSTPYREYKHYTNEGGIATPLIVSWPNGIDKSRNGSFVREYGYFADIMATCIDLSGGKYPKKYNGHDILPCEGVSLVPNFSGQPTRRGMTFWEHEVNIAVRDGKWKLNIHHVEDEPIDLEKLELYDMEKDPTELHNLAGEQPARAKEMFAAWDAWAQRVHAYPLSTVGYGRRQSYYRRFMNGAFEDNLGGWQLSCTGDADVSFEIDTVHVIHGKTARINVAQKGTRPRDAFMKWNFPNVDGPSTASVGFTYQTDKPNRLWLRLEFQNPSRPKVLDREILLDPSGGTVRFDGIELPQGRFQLVLYVGDTEPGQIWVDDVILNLKDKES